MEKHVMFKCHENRSFDLERKNPKIIVDDHDFYLESSRPTKSTWFCCMNYKTKCKVRVSTSGTYVVVNGVHNHLPRKRVNAKYRSKEVTIVRAS
ncbi:unnamed protein product [Acanthoscelides obtectus]|uniref:FLYWCH-type domain-containing protein n=1 Tax=Acanthoscelides obtectus TaxID=200917 RepID=A0A9P0MFM9_ACAOB|nr:unnamed protein product [Acanthoscelides obtectus]CAK1676576.1 hypothetical protein AOBTE_LOCUS30830 [Acanthoscelides obtectus]